MFFGKADIDARQPMDDADFAHPRRPQMRSAVTRVNQSDNRNINRPDC